MYQSSYKNLRKENFQSPLLTFVSGLQTIPAPSGASSTNVPTHVPLLCTIPTFIHLLYMCDPTSVCCIHGHPHIFFSLQSHLFCPTITSSYCSFTILRSCLCHGFMFFSFVSQYSTNISVVWLQCIYSSLTVYTNFYSVCQKSEIICSETDKTSEWITHTVIL